MVKDYIAIQVTTGQSSYDSQLITAATQLTVLTLYTLTSVYIFSTLLSIHFARS